MKIVFDGGILEHVGPKRSAEVMTLLLGALVECNLEYLKKHPKTPHPYKAGIRYMREVHAERWKGIPEILKDGEGDCEDLACYLAAYLVFHEVKPVSVTLRWKKVRGGGRLFHVLVRGPKGLEDPSKKLGM